MAPDFPALAPSSRTFTQGVQPVSTFETYSGLENRVLLGANQARLSLSLGFQNLTETQFNLILDHYEQAQGGYDTFALSSQVFAGITDTSYISPASYVYRYAAPPSVAWVSPGIASVSVELVGLVPINNGPTPGQLQATAFSFEDGEAQEGVFDQDTRSTDRAFDGAKSAKTRYAFADIKFTDAFPEIDAQYYMWSWRCYAVSNQYLTYFGTRDVLNGAGWDIKRASSTGAVGFYGSSFSANIGSDSSLLVFNDWNHFYLQLNWLNGKNSPPEVSVWINGTLIGRITPTVPYTQPSGTNASIGDFRVTRGNSAINLSRYYDYCFGATAGAPLVPMDQATIVPADIEAALTAAVI
jgi:hypothetical protein